MITKNAIVNCFALLSILLLSACLFGPNLVIKGKGNIKLTEVDFSEIEGWQTDSSKAALQAFLHSCGKFSKMPQNRLIGGQIGNIIVADFRDTCDLAQVVKTMDEHQTKNFFENWFRPFSVSTRSGNDTGTFTGYYEPTLRGSKIKTEQFKYPVYAKPKDLTSEPYLSRAEIESGALENKDLELIYVDDKVDLFFMHIQGSGRVKLPNGSMLRLSYAGRNNQPFTAVSNHMVDLGYIDRSNMASIKIREWLKNNPEKADEIMNINAAYTFFKISDGEYVVGSQGAPLTAERSLAVDPDIIPYGFPLFVATEIRNSSGSKDPYQHLLIAQDSGSAIKGTVRGDIFFGNGKEAEEKAFSMASQGKYYILLPINVADKF